MILIPKTGCDDVKSQGHLGHAGLHRPAQRDAVAPPLGRRRLGAAPGRSQLAATVLIEGLTHGKMAGI